jgi:hypothetical protein
VTSTFFHDHHFPRQAQQPSTILTSDDFFNFVDLTRRCRAGLSTRWRGDEETFARW